MCAVLGCIAYQCRLEDELLFPAVSEKIQIPATIAKRQTLAATGFREEQVWGDAVVNTVREAIMQGNGQKTRAKLKASCALAPMLTAHSRSEPMP